MRESETQPGDYAISYLSRSGYIHHFKINSNCGDYFIGGRQFMSLSELIGFYSNCSCILENESLELPVVPPKVCVGGLRCPLLGTQSTVRHNFHFLATVCPWQCPCNVNEWVQYGGVWSSIDSDMFPCLPVSPHFPPTASSPLHDVEGYSTPHQEPWH